MLKPTLRSSVHLQQTTHQSTETAGTGAFLPCYRSGSTTLPVNHSHQLRLTASPSRLANLITQPALALAFIQPPFRGIHFPVSPDAQSFVTYPDYQATRAMITKLFLLHTN